MLMSNFTLQDIFGVCLAFLLFPAALLFPGYVIGWAIDLFNFRRRHVFVRHIIAILTSISVTPTLFYLFARFFPVVTLKLIVVCFLIVYIRLVCSEIRKMIHARTFVFGGRYQRIAVLMALGWIILSMLSLIDLQWGTRLYNNVVSLDFSTRATLISAITRTGVPPVNPSYYPGNPEYINSLYYFWYILCSVIDHLGGDIVDSRMALIAGDIWSGLALMALIGLYIKIRNNLSGESAWKVAVFGIGLCTISGLDSIPASILMLATRFSYGSVWPHGDIEHWNEQITAWMGALFWVPHHLVALVVCLTGFLIFQYYRTYRFDSWIRIVPIVIVVGLAFASAVGLSTWITVAFAAFLGIWSIVLLTWGKDSTLFILLLITGAISLLFAAPFLVGLLQGGTADGGFPFAFEVRRFRFALPLVAEMSPVPQNLVYLLLLPINYFLELGFFFIVAVLWFRQYRKRELYTNRFLMPEIILLGMVMIAGSFVRSTVFATNDFGWRVWLLGQFILLVWATDLNGSISFLPGLWSFVRTSFTLEKNDIRKLLAFTLLIGFATTTLELALLRFWPMLVDMNLTGFPNSQSPDTNLGERTHDGRLAYEFINDRLPHDTVIQQNPLSNIDRIDRPSGLYANRQFAISYNAPFDVPLSVLKTRSTQIAAIFNLKQQDSWDTIDSLCRQYFIDALVVGDLDPLWDSLPRLNQQRSALYQNRYFAVLPCGDFTLRDAESGYTNP